MAPGVRPFETSTGRFDLPVGGPLLTLPVPGAERALAARDLAADLLDEFLVAFLRDRLRGFVRDRRVRVEGEVEPHEEGEALGQDIDVARSEEHTSELQSLMRISYAVLCLKKKKNTQQHTHTDTA